MIVARSIFFSNHQSRSAVSDSGNTSAAAIDLFGPAGMGLPAVAPAFCDTPLDTPLEQSRQSSLAGLAISLPPPASEDIVLTTPSVEWSTEDTLHSAPTLNLPSPLAISNEPRLVNLKHVVTPSIEVVPDLPLDTIVGAAIDPAPSHKLALPTPQPLLRTNRDLRLPSFDLLGIANPRPDLFRGPVSPLIAITPLAGGIGQEADGLEEADLPEGYDSETENVEDAPCDLLPRAAHARVYLQQCVTTLTPPAESGDQVWQSLVTLSTGAMDSPATDPGDSRASTGESAPTGSSTQAAAGPSSSSPAGLSAPRIQIQRSDSDVQRSSWLDEASEAMSK